MNRIRLGLFVPFAMVLAIMLPGRAGAQCSGAIAVPYTLPLELNLEGRTERPADFAITSAMAAQSCFIAGNSVRVTYNAILTNPVAVTTASTNNFSIADANKTLVVNITTTSGVGASGPQTVIEIDIITGTTDPLASFTLQNLRFDVTTIAPTALAVANMNAFLSSTVPATTPVATGIGIVRNTVTAAVPPGVGDIALPIGTGVQSSAGPLATQTSLSFASGAGWANINPFRLAITKPVVTTDIPTTATTLTFDVETIPAGVTVTFPTTMTVNPGATQVGFTATSGTLTATGGSLQVTYAATSGGANAPSFTLSIATGPTASDFVAGTLTTPAVPITIGVQISGSSGNGTAGLRLVFGPSEAAQFTGDNASATAIPRYIASDLPGASANRSIIVEPGPSPAPGTPVPFFTILPTQSVVLFQYATDEDSYATGLAITNTGNDSTIFNTAGQTGSITFFLFQSGVATPIVYQVKAGDGTGLNSAGNLAPGNVFAISLDALLNASGNGALDGQFSGYIIALCEFNYGHGFDIVFNPNGVGTAVNALYLGSGARLDIPGVGLGQ